MSSQHGYHFGNQRDPRSPYSNIPPDVVKLFCIFLENIFAPLFEKQTRPYLVPLQQLQKIGRALKPENFLFEKLH